MSRIVNALFTVGIILLFTLLVSRTYHPESSSFELDRIQFAGDSTRSAVLDLDRDQQIQLMALLNQGAWEEISEVPGVAQFRSRAIQQARPFEAPEEITRVEGVGERTFRAIVSYAQTNL
ncbi:MAG: hypothetical protein HKN23_04035 [Verrucomicrobiales bacterium]|nr:hypothetical protein [Verrucomicrobiales bacterium]